jgi:hypothetical protein
MQRIYDVIPAVRALHLPEAVRTAIQKSYDYILSEAFPCTIPEEASIPCVWCEGWCGEAQGVCCYQCKQYWHPRCTVPPMDRKPTKGYGWQCPLCTGKMKKEFKPINKEGSKVQALSK